MDLPDPKPNGICCHCNSKAETRDGRFCERCLHRLVKRLNPDERTISEPELGPWGHQIRTEQTVSKCNCGNFVDEDHWETIETNLGVVCRDCNID